jgi:hypothetical protein
VGATTATAGISLSLDVDTRFTIQNAAPPTAPYNPWQFSCFIPKEWLPVSNLAASTLLATADVLIFLYVKCAART